MSEVTLKMTVEQAAALVSLLDLASRIGMCQFGELEMWASMNMIKHRDGRELNYAEVATLRGALKYVASIFGFTPNASFGIGSPHVSDDVHRGYEIKKVLEKALAEHQDPNPKGIRGVNYDGLIVRYTKDPAPTATIQKGLHNYGPTKAQPEASNHAVSRNEPSGSIDMQAPLERPDHLAGS